MSEADETLFRQLALPHYNGECKARWRVLNDDPRNAQTIRWAIEDLKTLGITKLDGLWNENYSGPGTAHHAGGVDAIVYAVPDMNIVVRFTSNGRSYNHDDGKILGSNRPQGTNVMQNFMEFSVPNANPDGSSLYIEIGARGKDVGQLRADINAYRLKWQGVTGENRQPMFKGTGQSDFGSAQNNKSFGGRTKLIDPGEMDYHCFEKPNQSTDWHKMDEYKEITEAAKKGKWFDPKIHAELFERNQERAFALSNQNIIGRCHTINDPWKHNGEQKTPEEITRQIRDLQHEYIHELTTRQGPRAEHITTASALLDKHLPPPHKTAIPDIRTELHYAANGDNPGHLETLLRYGIENQNLKAQDLMAPNDRNTSVMKRLCHNPRMLKTIAGHFPASTMRETATHLEDTLLARALASAPQNAESMTYLASMQGVDLTMRASNGAGILDYPATNHHNRKNLYQHHLLTSRSESYESAKPYAATTRALESIIRAQGVNPGDCASKDGCYAQFAKAEKSHAEKQDMRRRVNYAWSQVPLP